MIVLKEWDDQRNDYQQILQVVAKRFGPGEEGVKEAVMTMIELAEKYSNGAELAHIQAKKRNLVQQATSILRGWIVGVRILPPSCAPCS